MITNKPNQKFRYSFPDVYNHHLRPANMALYNFSGNDLAEDFTRYEQRNDTSAVHPQFSSEPIWNIISDPDEKINGSICVRKLYPQIQTRFRIHKRFMRKFYSWIKVVSLIECSCLSDNRPTQTNVNQLGGKLPADQDAFSDDSPRKIVTPISFQARIHKQSFLDLRVNF